jgi:poly [ADP-ribose] polymerase
MSPEPTAPVIEQASSGRAKCRGCNRLIAKGELRLGERLPNPFGEGEMTLWFHVPCAAYKRPAPFVEAIKDTTDTIEGRSDLEDVARAGIEHRRLPRIDGVQRAPSGRARCRHCRELIEKDAWRIPLVYYEEGRFEPSGHIHLRCAPAYFETADVVDRLLHFTPTLTAGESEDLRAELARAEPPAQA